MVSSICKVPTTVLQIGVEIGERFSRSKAFVQNCLFDCSCVFENRTETLIFELIGSGFVVADNFHSQVLV